MRRVWCALALLALWGCAPAPTGGLRDASAPISSQAAVEIDRVTGTWRVVDGFEGQDLGAPGQVFQISQTANGLALADGAGEVRSLARIAPGRFAGSGGAPDLWLLWADADYRIAVMGNPAGTVGFIMMRDGAAGSGLRQAAREIFEWQGYYMARVVSVTP